MEIQMAVPRRKQFSGCFSVLISLLAGVAVLQSSAPALALDYPNHVVTIVVPFPAGGPLDFTARLLAERLSASLKQPFIVENKAGGAGNVGTEAVARAEPDGHTLLLVIDTPLTAHPYLYLKLPFDPRSDLAPISIIASFSQMLVVHPSVPVSTLKDFIRFAAVHQVTLGSGGAKGNPGYLALEALRAGAGFNVVHVPYRGNPQVVADLVGGQIEAGFLSTPSVIGLVKEGKLKGLAVSSSQRTPAAPEIPTVAESGYPGFDIAFSLVLAVPAKTPAAVRAVLEREIQKVMRSADVQSKLRSQELEPIGTTSEAAAAWVKSTGAKWQTIIKTMKIELD
jgi:tripartite-type tricarboxylate transporter receptor subunit TctC